MPKFLKFMLETLQMVVAHYFLALHVTKHHVIFRVMPKVYSGFVESAHENFATPFRA